MRILQPLCALAPVLLLAASCATTKEAAPSPAPAPVPTPFSAAVGQGIADVTDRTDSLVTATEALLEAIANRDLTAARSAYVEARAPYEEIEILRHDFPDLHLAIDGRPSDYPNGELDSDFRGFHAIELLLFARDNVRAALPYAEALYEDVLQLRGMLREPSQFDATQCFDSMIERTGEIAWQTITGEEEPWSDASMTVIRHGWIGVHALYRHFAGPVRERDGVLGEQLDRSYRKALELIAEDFPVGEASGTPYGIISRDKRRKIADASLALRARLIAAAAVLDLDVDA